MPYRVSSAIYGLLKMLLLIAAIQTAAAAPAAAGTMTLTWIAPTTNVDGSPLTDLAGYKIYYGTSPGAYQSVIDVGPTTTYSISGLTEGVVYYISVTAYDSTGAESAYSDEVSRTITPAAYTLTAAAAGTGAGSITSSPAGILCGYSCSASFAAGSTVTLSAAPVTGSVFTGWSGGCSGTGNCTVTMDATKTVTAAFALKTFTLSAAAVSNGVLTPAGATTRPYGAAQTYTITPNTGYYLSDVTVDGASVGALSTYTFSNIAADHGISATFKVRYYSITPSAGAGGSISPSAMALVPYGGSKTFTITPAAGYRISDVVVDGVSVGAVSTYTFTNLSAASHTIKAYFATATHTITAVVDGGGGSLLPSGAVTVASGGNGAFTITPDPGYHIADVLIDGASVGPAASYLFANVRADHTIVARFAINTYTITAGVSGRGAISPSGVVTAVHGGNAAFAISAEPGNVLVDVKVDGMSVGRTAAYTFTSVAANHTIEAVIAANLACPDQGIPCVERADGGQDQNNLVNGIPETGLTFDFRTVVADAGGVPHYVRLALARLNGSSPAAFHYYDMACSGDFSAGALCSYAIPLAPGPRYAFYLEARLSDGSITTYASNGYINGPQIDLTTAESFTTALQPGWNSIINPYRENILLAALEVRNGQAAAVSWKIAAENGWLQNGLYDFSGSEPGRTRLFDEAGGVPDAVLVPWRTYWIYAAGANEGLTLIIKKPAPSGAGQ